MKGMLEEPTVRCAFCYRMRMRYVAKFAADHGLKALGHTLMWHNQTPDFFWLKEDGSVRSQEEMKANLVEYIEKTGSIQEACLEMGLSYSKGARMIKMAEKQLGFKLLERRVGGSGGGGSRLTDEGRDLLKKYRQLTLRVQQDADRAFAEIFGSMVSGNTVSKKQGTAAE